MGKYSKELPLDEQLECVDRNILANWEAYKDPIYKDQRAENYKRVDMLLDARLEISKEAELEEVREAVDKAYSQ